LPVVQAAVPEACSRTATPTSRFRNSIRSRPPLPPYAPTAPASQSRVSVLCAVISPSPCASPCASHRPSLSVSRLRPLRSHQSLTVCLTVCLPPPQPLSLASPSSAQRSHQSLTVCLPPPQPLTLASPSSAQRSHQSLTVCLPPPLTSPPCLAAGTPRRIGHAALRSVRRRRHSRREVCSPLTQQLDGSSRPCSLPEPATASEFGILRLEWA
jgi:hypothetical protein